MNNTKHKFKVGDKVIFTGESSFLNNDTIYEVQSVYGSKVGVTDRFGDLMYRNNDYFKPYSINIVTTNELETIKDYSGDIDNKIKILEEQLKTLKDAKLILKGE